MNESVALDLQAEQKALIDEFIHQFPISEADVDEHYRVPKTPGKRQRFSRKMFSSRKRRVIPPPAQKVPASIRRFQRSLPVHELRSSVLATIDGHQVTLLTGGTGCGKTTQVPQFLLEEATSKRTPVRIICTQPRRLPTIAISRRVAVERGEQLGATVGYQIRLENRVSPSTALIYCTSGVLLRMLTADATAQQFSHIILDEVHEREQKTDYLLIAIKQALRKRKDLKVILMSATMEGMINMFKAYFNSAVGHIDVPSRLFNVDTFYLADILALTGYLTKFMDMKENTTDISKLFASNVVIDDGPVSETFGRDTAKKRFGKLKLNDRQRYELTFVLEHLKRVFPNPPAYFTKSAHEKLRKCELRSEPLEIIYATLESKFAKDIEADLILKIIVYLLDSPIDGAILVFLPGYENIMQVYIRVVAPQQTKTKPVIFALHSMIDSQDQQAVFEPVQPGCRKVILSTNIAEASLTIDDVVFVIDNGKAKEQFYDHSTRVNQLKMSWIAKSNAEQRRGRAGRCRNGYCFRLYAESVYKDMLDAQVPEIQRVAIHDVCLHAKMFAPKGTSVKAFLKLAPEPPPIEAVEQSLEFLNEIDAFCTDKSCYKLTFNAPRGLVSRARIRVHRPITVEPELTELGRMLAVLPLESQLSRLLLFGLALKCFEPIITLVSMLSYRDPFVLPFGDELSKALEVRYKFGKNDFSDHLMMIRVFYSYSENNPPNADFCCSNFLNQSTMRMITGIRNQLFNEMKKMNFLPQNVEYYNDLNINQYRNDWPMIQGAIVGGCHPCIGVVRDSVKLRKIRINSEKDVIIHSHSVIKHQKTRCVRTLNNPVINFLACHEMSKCGSRTAVRIATAVPPLAVFMFSGSIRANRGKMERCGLVSVSDVVDGGDLNPVKEQKNDKPTVGEEENDVDSSDLSSSSGDTTTSDDDIPFDVPLHSWMSFIGTFAVMQPLVRLRHKFMSYLLRMQKNPSRNTTNNKEEDELLKCISQALRADHRRNFFDEVNDLQEA